MVQAVGPGLCGMHPRRYPGGPVSVRGTDFGSSGSGCTRGRSVVWNWPPPALAGDVGCLRGRCCVDCSDCRVLAVIEYSCGRWTGGSCYCVAAVLHWHGQSRHHGRRSSDCRCSTDSEGTEAFVIRALASLLWRSCVDEPAVDVSDECQGRRPKRAAKDFPCGVSS